MKTPKTILSAIADPKLFAPSFRDPETWHAWRAFLAALFAPPMDDEQLAIYREHTGRTDPPAAPFAEGWLICGRRAGKSAMLALCAVYLATFRDYRPHLSPGERATIRIVAQNRGATRNIFRYIAALIRGIPLLAQMIVKETGESFELSNRVVIEVGSSSFRVSRGYAYCAILCDELAFWFTDADSANPDTEVLRSLRPGMLQFPGAVLLCASTPYAKRGELWETFQRSFGKADPRVLVWKAPTVAMNPTVPQAEIDAEMAKDPANAMAEYMVEFRGDIQSFIGIEEIRACIEPGVRERPPDRQQRYFGFCDPSGGKSDSMTMAIAHKEGATCILDVIREAKPPFSPEATVEEFSRLLKVYRCTSVFGDRYAGMWPVEQFHRHSINYLTADRNKNEIYLDFLPLMNSGGVDLLDHDRMVLQFVSLERSTPRGGRDKIDHGRGAHDDIANAVAGAITVAAQQPAGWRRRRKYDPDAPKPPEWTAERYLGPALAGGNSNPAWLYRR
jgi:hypothetical protein